MTRNELREYVKRQLGYPTVNVELTDNQLDDAINNALSEIKPWYTVFRYLTIDAAQCVDLTEYQILDVTDVIKVLSYSSSSSNSGYDPFTYNASVIGYPSFVSSRMMYTFSRYGRTNIHTVISKYAQMNYEMFYNKLASILDQRIAGTLSENISWKFYDNKLYLDTGVPHASVVTVEYIPKIIEVEDVDCDTRYGGYLKELSVAFALMIQARVTGKYTISGSPATINYSDMRSDAQEIISRVRDELKKTANMFYITD